MLLQQDQQETKMQCQKSDEQQKIRSKYRVSQHVPNEAPKKREKEKESKRNAFISSIRAKDDKKRTPKNRISSC